MGHPAPLRALVKQRVVIVIAVVMLGLLFGWTAPRGGRWVGSTRLGAHTTSANIDDDDDGPLFDGQTTDYNVATLLLVKCGCPLLPPNGPASKTHVTQSYINTVGDVAFVFDNGMHIIYSVDSRTPTQYANAVSDAIAAGTWQGAALVPSEG